jgi:hypothetical protein
MHVYKTMATPRAIEELNINVRWEYYRSERTPTGLPRYSDLFPF